MGVAVLAVAVVALRHQNHNSADGAPPPTITRTVTGPPTTVTNTPTTHPPTSGTPGTSGTHTPGTVTTSTPGSPSTSEPAWHAYIGSEPLIVLNVVADTSDDTLAEQAAQRFERGGWTVTSTDEDYDNSIESTVAYYDPSIHGARHAALVLRKQFPVISRVEPRFAPAPGGDPLPAGPVVVVLTADYVQAQQ